MKIKDIAEQLGVSCATVSMALNDRPGVNPQTRQRVLEYSNSVHYGENRVEKPGTKSGVYSFIVYKRHGLIVTDTQFFNELIEAVAHSAHLHKFRLDLLYCHKDETNDVLRTLKAAKSDGVLLLATEMNEDDFAPFRTLSIPMTVLDCDLLDCGTDKVLINNREGMWKAVKFLYDHGNREIGYLHSTIPIRNYEQRADGYREALRRLGLVQPAEPVLLEPSVDVAYAVLCDRLEKGLKLPSALVADNDVLAFVAAQALKKFGYRIPEDVSIVGFDDVPICMLAEPALTTVRVPRRVLGSTAVNRLTTRIQKPNAPQLLTQVDTEIIERGSVN